MTTADPGNYADQEEGAGVTGDYQYGQDEGELDEEGLLGQEEVDEEDEDDVQ